MRGRLRLAGVLLAGILAAACDRPFELERDLPQSAIPAGLSKTTRDSVLQLYSKNATRRAIAAHDLKLVTPREAALIRPFLVAMLGDDAVVVKQVMSVAAPLGPQPGATLSGPVRQVRTTPAAEAAETLRRLRERDARFAATPP